MKINSVWLTSVSVYVNNDVMTQKHDYMANNTY